ncbi:MAG: 1,4-beta-xylanase [Blastopirellula sp.]|nr:1,4-beta-xylanase [Blastopirellula sp.]
MLRFTSLAVLGPLLFTPWLPAKEFEVRRLWAGDAPQALGQEAKDQPRLLIRVPPRAQANGTAIVICPGGGYGGLAMDHEGHQIAEWLNSLGIAGFILDYRHRGKGYGHPAPMLDVQRAVRCVRADADKYGVQPDKIGVLGFSAGGHLASTAATQFDAGDPQAKDRIDRVSCRPDFAVLCYPVIAFDQPYTHRGSQRNLLGADAAPALVAQMSSERRVTAETPPTFLWHTTDDKAVPVENSIYFYLAARRAGVASDLHVYKHGRHGLGLARGVTGASAWPRDCENWLRANGFLPK